MKKWFAECINKQGDIMTLKTRAFTQEQAIENLATTYQLKMILTISDQSLFKTPIQSYMSSSLAGML